MKESAFFKDLVQKASAELDFLPDKPEENPESTIAALWCAAAGNPVSIARAGFQKLPPLNGKQHDQLMEFYQKRRSGVPVQHITGRQQFLDIELLAGPGALIPRRETEILGKAALGIVAQLSKEKKDLHILDVCTGGGNIACLIAHHFPDAYVYASDLSPDAIDLAGKNAEFLSLQDRMDIRCGDLLKPFENEDFFGTFDVITCNPPYISSGRVDTMNTQIIGYEPRLAFDGGPFGIKILQALINEAPRYITDKGWLAFETGLGQGEAMKKRLEKRGFTEIEEFHDEEHNIRALKAMNNIGR